MSSPPPLNRTLGDKITPISAAQKYVLCQYNIPRALLDTAIAITPGKRKPTVTALDPADWFAVSSMVESKRIATVMDELLTCGAMEILVLDIKNSRVQGHP